MFRKTRRNFVRWLLKPFLKPEKPIEWQPTAPLQKQGERRSLTKAVADYYNGNGDGTYLKATIEGSDDWEELHQARGQDASHDLIPLIAGSASQLLTHFHDFITEQNPDTNNTAILAGTTVTPGDELPLSARERQQSYWVRRTEQTLTGSVYKDTPPSHRIISRLLGCLPATGGCGGDQLAALHTLLTDPFTVPHALKFMEDVYRAYQDYASLACALLTVETGGGTYPIHRFLVSVLKAKITVNRHYKLYLLPTDAEPLHIRNLRGTLAYDCEYEAANTLHLLFQQETAGAHKTDRALVSGLITLTGASRTRLNGGIDPVTKFNLIRDTAGAWLVVTPRIVSLPLIPMGRVVIQNGYRNEDAFLASLREELGGKRISPIVEEIYKLVVEDPSALHYITVASSLNPDEMTAIATGVKRFPLQPGGRVQVFFNTCYMAVSAVTETAEALLCDFRGGNGVRDVLTGFLSEQHRPALATGFSPAERRALASQVPERHLTEEIERELQRILKLDHL
jgi:hypothetical protein